MQPYEIRQLPDGSIDYNNYYARPASLLARPAWRSHRGATLSYRKLAATLRLQSMRRVASFLLIVGVFAVAWLRSPEGNGQGAALADLRTPPAVAHIGGPGLVPHAPRFTCLSQNDPAAETDAGRELPAMIAGPSGRGGATFPNDAWNKEQIP